MALKILIVEDLFVEANDLRIILEEGGHLVTGMAKSVDQAHAAIKRDRPDIVLLDIFLKGDLTGIHLARNLAAANIPFIYLSANSNASTLEAAKSTHPYGFLTKPFREKDILLALDIASDRHRHATDLTQRQERLLGDLLGGVISQAATQEQKLMMLAKVFKTFIPFDLLFIDLNPNMDDPAALFGCQRVDFEEFVSIDIGKLLQKPASKTSGVQSFRELFPYPPRITILEEKDFLRAGGRLSEKLQRLYGIRSVLSVPVTAEKEKSFSIFFMSLQPDSYAAEQMKVLGALRGTLLSVLENIRKPKSSASIDEPPAHPLMASGIPPALGGIVGKSARLLHVFDQVVQVASVDSTVLISGETGVGKEGIAAAIHNLSTRNKRPYIKVNCAAIPDTLIESELFGHERGAFTTAFERRIGKFEQAGGGTIFLDEIGELPLQAQSKLLRVLQEKEVERLGGGMPIKVNVRIIAATNRNLQKEVAAGKFRMDLYYRLNVFPIHLPSLRERREDIPLLIDHFLKQHAVSAGGIPKSVSPAVLQGFMTYSWPGNIRELQYMIERYVVTTKGPVISEVELPDEEEYPGEAFPGRSLQPGAVIGKEQIIEALRHCNGKVAGAGGAAEALGINPNTLTSKMRKLGISWKYLLVLLFVFWGTASRSQTRKPGGLEALQHAEADKRSNDTFRGAEKDLQLADLKAKYETDQKDKDLQLEASNIHLLTRENLLQQVQAGKSRLLRNGMIGSIAVLGLLAGVMWSRYLLKRRSNSKLILQKEEIQSNNHRLARLLQENKWLFEEMHYRVRNNLQVVISLLNSQMSYLKDPAALHAITESRHRVQAMSLIHQKLYKSTEESTVDMPEYIGELVDYLRDSFDSERKVDLEPQIAPVKLDVSQAVPLGLILNEVITNSYKYAFPYGSRDGIVLQLDLETNGEVRLSIGDNGKGLPDNVRPGSNAHFGISLIYGLAGDLDATLDVRKTGGLVYTLCFKRMLPVQKGKVLVNV